MLRSIFALGLLRVPRNGAVLSSLAALGVNLIDGVKDHRRDTMDRPPLAYCCEVRDEAALCDGAICTESGQVKKD